MPGIRFEEIAGPYDAQWNNFQLLCSLLAIREFPVAKAIEGKGGDEGIDTLIGTIGDAERIFQAKYFCDTLTEVQKRQIRSSLKTAVEKHKPAMWTLVVRSDRF